MGFVTATGDRLTFRNFGETIGIFRALAASGFRRHATYRQATIAAALTNTMFGFLRTFVLLAVAANGVVAGYSGASLATYVWVGQGLLGVVVLGGWTDLSDRIRSGEFVMDLLRPVHPVWVMLSADLGRAAHAVLVRFTVPIAVGALVFGLYLPQRLATYPLFAVSVVLAVVVSFACRYLVNSVSFWLLDNRGANIVWMAGAGLLGGLYFPIRFLPDWAALLIWVATPGPSLLQAPLDVLVERDPPSLQWAIVAVQLAWAVLLLLLCHRVQRRAERRLVIQGG